jgi:DnaK suppressor protein
MKTEGIELPKGYKPSQTEKYMNPMQLEYFRRKLMTWKADLLKDSADTLAEIKQGTADTYGSAGDDVDRANDEAAKQLELRVRDRERKVIGKIDEALARIDDGSYGYCEITGEPIGLKRLEAKPTATMSVEAQEEHEAMEKQFR